MMRLLLVTFAALTACASAQVNETASSEVGVNSEAPSEPPKIELSISKENTPEESLAVKANFAEAMQQVEDRQKVFDDEPERYSLTGNFAQGGLVFGQTEPGAKVKLDGDNVMVGVDGRFVIGFGRDSALTSLLVVTLPDGVVERHAIEIEDREFPVQRIDGLDQSKVSGFTEEQLAKIAADSAKKESRPSKNEAGS